MTLTTIGSQCLLRARDTFRNSTADDDYEELVAPCETFLIQLHGNLMPHEALLTINHTLRLPIIQTNRPEFHHLTLLDINLLTPLPTHSSSASIEGIEIRIQGFFESLYLPVAAIVTTAPTAAGRRM